MQILKLGGSAITKKRGYMEADRAAIAVLARAIARVWKAGKRDIIIVHGAGSFGHAPVLHYGINNGVRKEKQKLGYSATHASCAHLSSLIVDALINNKVPAVSIPPAAIIQQKDRRIEKFDEKAVMVYLSAGYLPILFGDMVLDSKLGGSVCSGDQIVAFLGKKAKRIVLATNVDGVLANNKVVPKITRQNFSEIAKHIGSSSCPDVTGGMAGKISELLKVKAPSFVVNARKPDRVKALLLGKKTVCTEIRF